MGRFSTGGATSASGMLIGAEFYSATSDTPRDELGDVQRNNVASLDSLPFIIAHEHVHVQQAAAGSLHAQGTTLLE